MSAAERILALGDYSGLNMPSDYIDRLDSITDVLPLIADLVEAAERAVPVIAQGERAMQELIWTQRDVTARGALEAALTALERKLVSWRE